MPRRFYPRPPIVEAIIEFRLEGDVAAADIAAALRSALSHEYSNAPAEPESARGGANRAQFLVARDGLRLLAYGQAYMSVHVLAPYPGWESFIEQARAAVNALTGSIENVAARALAVRYVDRIQIPLEPALHLDDYLTLLPKRPAALPDLLTGFRFGSESQDEEGLTARILVASERPIAEGYITVGYDLMLARETTDKWLLSSTAWEPIVEELHSRQREIFEQSITETTRELFQ